MMHYKPRVSAEPSPQQKASAGARNLGSIAPQADGSDACHRWFAESRADAARGQGLPGQLAGQHHVVFVPVASEGRPQRLNERQTKEWTQLQRSNDAANFHARVRLDCGQPRHMSREDDCTVTAGHPRRSQLQQLPLGPADGGMKLAKTDSDAQRAPLDSSLLGAPRTNHRTTEQVCPCRRTGLASASRPACCERWFRSPRHASSA
jgi:hypothetical protein